MAERYPLTWPQGWRRTPAHKRRSSAYKVSETSARNELECDQPGCADDVAAFRAAGGES